MSKRRIIFLLKGSKKMKILSCQKLLVVQRVVLADILLQSAGLFLEMMCKSQSKASLNSVHLVREIRLFVRPL